MQLCTAYMDIDINIAPWMDEWVRAREGRDMGRNVSHNSGRPLCSIENLNAETKNRCVNVYYRTIFKSIGIVVVDIASSEVGPQMPSMMFRAVDVDMGPRVEPPPSLVERSTVFSFATIIMAAWTE